VQPDRESVSYARWVLEPLPILTQLPVVGASEERSDAAENRRRILSAARRLLTQGGAEALSMDAVAAEAGVGKGTVFRRFGGRAGLTEALLDDYMREFQDAFLSGPPPLGPGAPPAERLHAFVEALVRLQHRNLPIALAAELPDGERVPIAYGPIHIHLRVLIKALDHTLDAPVMATMILGATSPAVLDRLTRFRGDGVETVVASMTALLRGIAPQ
jgi:AcrR family transcriptional regulator